MADVASAQLGVGREEAEAQGIEDTRIMQETEDFNPRRSILTVTADDQYTSLKWMEGSSVTIHMVCTIALDIITMES